MLKLIFYLGNQANHRQSQQHYVEPQSQSPAHFALRPGNQLRSKNTHSAPKTITVTVTTSQISKPIFIVELDGLNVWSYLNA
jgi:hypothetical protein